MNYTIKVHWRDKLIDDVSSAMTKIFHGDFKDGSHLVVVESIATLDTPKKLTKMQITRIQDELCKNFQEICKPRTVEKVEIVQTRGDGS